MATRRMFTDEQRAFLAERYPDMTNRELCAEFARQFGEPIDGRCLCRFAKARGLRKTAETMRRTRDAVAESNRVYTDEQLDWLRGFIPGHSQGEIAAAFADRYGLALTMPTVKNLKTKLGVPSGTVGGRFQKGNLPPNKGKTWDECFDKETQERLRANCFKKGNVPHNACHRILDTKLDGNGNTLIYVKPRDAAYSQSMWISYARFVWMQHNGREFPEDHRCVHADRNPANYDPANLVAVPNDIYGIITGANGGIDYWDVPSLEVAIAQARLIRTRARIENARPRRCTACGEVFRPTERQLGYGSNVRRCPACRKANRCAPRKRKEVGS